MQFKSKSQMFRELFTKIDNCLNKIPDNDYKGNPLVDSEDISKHINDMLNIFYGDREGNIHKPLSVDFCTKLIYDELDSRQEVKE